MTKPIISLIAPSIRPQFWMEFYNSLLSNDTSFEIIFVGHIKPDFELPDNFKYVYSKVKPVQCVEAASRRAQGEYLIVASDDYELSPHALDKLYDLHKRTNDEKVLVSCRYSQDGQDPDSNNYELHYPIGEQCAVNTPMCALWPTELYRELGGADIAFTSVYWNVDLTLRFYQTGGKMIYVEDAVVSEYNHKHVPHRIHHEKWAGLDKAFLDFLWIRDNQIIERTLPFEGFKDTNILLNSQGQRYEGFKWD